MTLREECPITEFFLVRIFLYSDWIRRFKCDCALYVWKIFQKTKISLETNYSRMDQVEFVEDSL